MATAIEYGLIAALISVVAITAIVKLTPDESTGATCTAAAFNEKGQIQLNCVGQSKGVRLYLTSSELALAQAIKPRPMTCLLYKKEDAICSLQR